jgi:hypothetical protein
MLTFLLGSMIYESYLLFYLLRDVSFEKLDWEYVVKAAMVFWKSQAVGLLPNTFSNSKGAGLS